MGLMRRVRLIGETDFPVDSKFTGGKESGDLRRTARKGQSVELDRTFTSIFAGEAINQQQAGKDL